MTIARPGLLLIFLSLVLGGGFTIGAIAQPDEWYGRLIKPSFTPPPWVFPVAWSILYTCVAIAGYRTFNDQSGRAMKIWWLQLALNFLWPIVFFKAHQIGLAFALLMLLLTAILAFMTTARDTTSKVLFSAYAAWVAFAALLNGSIFAAN